MAYIEKRKNGWCAQVRRQGLPSISRTFDLKAAAEAWAREIEREAQRGNLAVFRDDAGKVTIADAVRSYRTAVLPRLRSNSAPQYLRAVEARFGAYFISAVRGIDVASWRDDLLKSGLGSQSVIHHLGMLSAVFSYAEKELSIALPAGNPVRAINKPELPPSRERRLVGAEYEYLLRAADAKRNRYSVGLRQVIIFAVETAARASEILSLNWSDVDIAKSICRVRGVKRRKTKNGDTFRVVALSPAAVAALQSLPRRIDGKVFTWKTPCSMETVWTNCKARALRIYNADCAAQAVKPDPAFMHDLHFHDLRHEATSRLFEKNLGIMEVASMTGHKSLAMLKRYTHIDAERLALKLG
ncbi:Integrase family protein [Thiomonas sp. X19]|uniref:tyrosine-type recombinase/integrase n=1 Tax=Thiomonas sp. X19 TaxID=1050370 RepID=UPI000B6D897A|nr:tyrosine-type recombinase/integrase [Thiomonas sp. X19]SCC94459.1 Integrase family protein [Thiomonas sp. X19]